MKTSSAEIESVLAQMRLLAAQARFEQPPAQVAPGGVGFADALAQAVNEVNDLQRETERLAARFERGDAEVDLANVMVSLQKAGVAFQAMTQVRNRLVSAYQDIMNMPI